MFLAIAISVFPKPVWLGSRLWEESTGGLPACLYSETRPGAGNILRQWHSDPKGDIDACLDLNHANRTGMEPRSRECESESAAVSRR